MLWSREIRGFLQRTYGGRNKPRFHMEGISGFALHNGVKGYVIEASCAKDGKAHVIGFDTTYVFRSEFCMDIGDCECIVIEFDKR